MKKTSIKIEPSCADDYDPNSLPVAEALRRIDSEITPISGIERVAVRSALGRVLAEDIHSHINVPAHTNSAMDGYAVVGQDLPASGNRELRVIGTAWAGRPFTGGLRPGECVRIMTGAKMPPGTDTVVMQERAERDGDVIRIGPGNRPGQNVRQAGEDLAKGGIVLTAGKKLLPAELGLLASLGFVEITVKRRLRVAFFSTGDELRSAGEPLAEGDIYDSNRYTLHAMLTRLGVDITDMGVVRDRREDLEQALKEAAQAADAIITTGGVSVGEADFIKETLASQGRVNFWKIAMKPGRPLAFGRIDNAVFFGLPGNPVSVMVTYYQFVQPALRRLMGQTDTRPPRIMVPCVSRLKKTPGRMEFQRGILETDSNGRLVVRSTGEQGSGILSSMSKANCFIVLPMEAGAVEPETLVAVELFEGLI